MTKIRKIVAAMSGGVDSTVAAALFKEQGCEVIGVTLKTKKPALCALGGCSSEEDYQSAVNAAQKLGIEHRFLEVFDDFEQKVLKYSWEEYKNGRTPNPCTFCNYFIKFGSLLSYAESIGADHICTGHYAKLHQAPDGHFEIRRGDDPGKDQTYFLYRLEQRQLAKTRFPVGDMTKEKVRAYARKLNLDNSEKKDSQDACFGVPGECFAETLRKVFDGNAQTGDFIYHGNKVGRHNGIHQYTIGQRKGLGIALGKPAFVKYIDPITGVIELTTDNDDLLAAGCEVKAINWQSGLPEKESFECKVQIRYRSKPVNAIVRPGPGSNTAEVLFKSPQRAVTCGQAAVFYDSDILLGGGIISASNIKT